MLRTIVLIVFLFQFFSTVSAEERVDYDNKLGMAWFWGYPGYSPESTGPYYSRPNFNSNRINLDYARKMKEKTFRVWEAGFSSGSHSFEFPTNAYNNATSRSEDTIEYRQYDSSGLSVGVGTRKYLKFARLDPFFQYMAKFSASYGYGNYYYAFENDKAKNKSTSISAGIGVGVMFGVEYFFTSQFSVAAHYEIDAQYFRALIKSPGDFSSFSFGDSSGLRFGWYW